MTASAAGAAGKITATWRGLPERKRQVWHLMPR